MKGVMVNINTILLQKKDRESNLFSSRLIDSNRVAFPKQHNNNLIVDDCIFLQINNDFSLNILYL